MSESSQNGTTHGYYVEAMSASHWPERVGKQIFDTRWRRVSFDEAAVGVPIARPCLRPIMELAGVYSYEAAQALRWWFHAASEKGICLRSRIVKCSVKYSVEVERQSEHCEIGGDDRSNFMPDWDKPESSENP